MYAVLRTRMVYTITYTPPALQCATASLSGDTRGEESCLSDDGRLEASRAVRQCGSGKFFTHNLKPRKPYFLLTKETKF